MTLYVDTSAFLKLYVAEPDSANARALVRSDPVVATCWLTVVELRRNLSRLLDGIDFVEARQAADTDLDAVALIDLGEVGWRLAADIAEELGVRSLDALHLAAARRLANADLAFCTFDLRQAQAARRLGFTVVGS